MAGTLAINNMQLGDSSTASQNFVLKTNSDGTATLARGNVGSTSQDILTIGVDGKVTLTNGEVITISKLQSGTVRNSTSGTSIDFTGIPSWAKRITVIMRDVSTNGGSPVVLQVGSGSIQTTSYGGSSTSLAASSLTTTGFANGITFGSNTTQAGTTFRQGIFTIVNIASTNYVITCAGAFSDAAASAYGGATTSLGGILDRVRLTTVNGTDVFDSGTINIFWE